MYRIFGAFLVCAAVAAAQSGAEGRIPLPRLRDQIAGGWAGQMIGVSYGASTEFRSRGAINESALPPWTPERVSERPGGGACHQRGGDAES